MPDRRVSYGRLTNRLLPDPCTLSSRKAAGILPGAFVSHYFMTLHRRYSPAVSTEDAELLIDISVHSGIKEDSFPRKDTFASRFSELMMPLVVAVRKA
jgi:hypothetical protein